MQNAKYSEYERMIHVAAFAFIFHLDFTGLIIKCHWDSKHNFSQNSSVFFKAVPVRVAWKLPINEAISEAGQQHWSLCV